MKFMDRIYFNDEWNEPISLTNDKIMKYQIFYRECYKKIEEKLEEELLKKHSDCKTVLPKDYEGTKV